MSRFLPLLLLLGACTGSVAGEPPRQQFVSPDGGPPPFEGVMPEDPRFDPPPEAFERCGLPEEQRVLELTNQARAAVGSPALTCDDDLTRAARLHSWDMCERSFFAHDAPHAPPTNPSPYGPNVSDRVAAQGVEFRFVGENIARGYPTPEAVHSGWMNSPGHRRNIELGSYGRIGIGLYDCGGSRIWTQNFAD